MQEFNQNKELKIKNLLVSAKIFLKSSKVKDVSMSASIDAEKILCFVLNFDQKDLFLNFDKEISLENDQIFRNLLKKRFVGRPISYLTWKKDFFDFEFSLNEKTLIPREDSEILIKKALEIFERKNKGFKTKKFLQIADFGSGSGCLGLAFIKKYGNAKCFLIEKNLFASRKIRENAKNLDLLQKTEVFHGNWNDFHSKFCIKKFDLIISNPPYINPRKKFGLMKSVVCFEPNYALFDLNQENLKENSTYQQILERAEKLLKKNGYLIFEIDEKRQPIFFEKQKFRLIGIYNDLYGLPRCMILQKIF
jgi:release factor glutamine methyltransferase